MDETSDKKPTIVVGVDGSEPSERALRWAAEEASLRNAEIHVVQAWEPPLGVWASPAGAFPEPAWDHEDFQRDVQRDLVAFIHETIGPNLVIDLRTSTGVGNPADVLIKAADQDLAQMVVVGSRGKGGFRRLLLGSVSEQVTAHAHCPVVVVHSPGEGN